MSTPRDTIEVDGPKSPVEREALLSELEILLASQYFRNSKRYPALLRHVVTHTLEGNADLLKERTLGVDVFERPASYDTSADTIVRYTASEVRKRLQLYYHDLGHVPEWQFFLPAGSYTPRFLHTPIAPDPASSKALPEQEPPPLAHIADSRLAPTPDALSEANEGKKRHTGSILQGLLRPSRWVSLLLLFLLIGGLFTWMRMRGTQAGQAQTALQDFWNPVLDGHKEITICTGSSVLEDNGFSNTRTAGKYEEYPFISFQIAAGLTRLGQLFGSRGANVEVLSSASTPLSALRDKPLVLIGGYNNQWTLRLSDGLRFHFSPNLDKLAIQDSMKPEVLWSRQPSVSYGSADDYALISRFRDAKTGDWVIVLAGIGRNGTEAAAQFVTEERYLEGLQQEFKGRLPSGNLQVILHLSVVDGRTGAPEILAVTTW